MEESGLGRTDTVPRNLLTVWSRVLMDALAGAGVETVVISPGSRSTPFVVAALEEPRLECRSVIDERDAAFYALGRGKVSGRPSLLLCTSGSAGAHYLPAVLEAERSGTPLLLLTADRPTELRDCGAPQTTDQIKLFSDHVRGFFELGLPEANDDVLRGLRRTAVQAVLLSRWPVPGPVHLNAPARKPLEPRAELEEPTAEERSLRVRVDELLAQDPPSASPGVAGPARDAVARIAEALSAARSGLIVVGALSPVAASALAGPVRRLAERSGLPVSADVTSGLRESDGPLTHHGDWFGSDAFRAHGPEVVLQVGAAPISSSWAPWMHRSGARLLVVGEHGWSDPTGRAVEMALGAPAATLAAVAEASSQGPERSEGLGALDARLEREVSELLVEGDGWSEGRIAREVMARLPAGSLLGLGNSLPVRLAETFGGRPEGRLRVFHQRGLSGIDGLVAGFAGALAAMKDEAPPTALLLIGDISLLHDLGGLGLLEDASPGTAVLVINNGGGRIFEQLPLARQEGFDRPERMAPWTTPHRRDFAAAARLFGLDHVRLDDPRSLAAELDGLSERRRPVLFEARVPEHGAAELERRWRARVEGAVTRWAEERP